MSTPVQRPKGIRRESSSGKVRKSSISSTAKMSEVDAAKAATEAVKNLTFPQLRVATRVPKETNDLAWAGRLQPFAPFWWGWVIRISMACLLISFFCLFLVLWSVFTRSPPLLIGVYPSGSELCFPELVNGQGKLVPRSSVYNPLCDALNARSGAMWVLDPSTVQTDPDAVYSVKPEEAYLTPDQALAQIKASANSVFSVSNELPDGPVPAVPAGGNP